jgi:hypothetical protein
MTIEKADQPKVAVHVIWSPGSERTRPQVERTLPLSEEIRFEFYRPATSNKGGVYAEG